MRKTKQMVELFREVERKQISKTDNYRADMLAKMATTADPKLPKSVSVEIKYAPSIEGRVEVMAVDT